jgi:hypothetical protein
VADLDAENIYEVSQGGWIREGVELPPLIGAAVVDSTEENRIAIVELLGKAHLPLLVGGISIQKKPRICVVCGLIWMGLVAPPLQGDLSKKARCLGLVGLPLMLLSLSLLRSLIWWISSLD